MKHIGRFTIILMILMSVSINAVAQHLKVSAPSHVAAGENFRVAYTINARDVEEFRMGNVPNGLEVIAGPYTSQQSSYQMINGHTSSSSSVTITYTLYAAKNGVFTIGSSQVLVGGKNWHPALLRLMLPDRLPIILMVLPRCMEEMIMTNLLCDRLVPAFLAATSSSRFLPTRNMSQNKNLSC